VIAWELLDSAVVPGDSSVLRLLRRGTEYSIRVDHRDLMSSVVHGSEEALADLACGPVAKRPGVRVLVGGLGCGYTLAAALKCLGAEAQVVVAEVVPAVVAWNRQYLGHLAGQPLLDPRTEVHEGDVGALLRKAVGAFDAVMLDVDNGPNALTRGSNEWLYSPVGLASIRQALRPGGVLAVWSAAPDRSFTSRLRRGDYVVEEVEARARGNKGGRKHYIWVAKRRD
jgi:spermidine synthase